MGLHDTAQPVERKVRRPFAIEPGLGLGSLGGAHAGLQILFTTLTAAIQFLLAFHFLVSHVYSSKRDFLTVRLYDNLCQYTELPLKSSLCWSLFTGFVVKSRRNSR